MLYKILKIVAIVISLLAAVWLVRIVLAGDNAIADSVDLQSSLVTPLSILRMLFLL